MASPSLSRRHLFSLALAGPVLTGTASARQLPLKTRFRGATEFRKIVANARKENWASLPIGERMVKFGRELHGKPYKGYTLEIDDHVEAASANFNGVDCWTFFEICLGLSRMVVQPEGSWGEEALLQEIEFTRYRAGSCGGNYLDRIHYLAEWFFENEARGVAEDITKELGHAQRIEGRKIREMTVLWKSYRYLKNNPELRTPMAQLESQIAQLPVYYIPSSKAHLVEKKMKNGDIIGIATKHDGGFCSHVGMAVRTNDGVMRIMHASSNYKRVVIDKSVSGYLNHFSSHMGMIVARPLEVDKTVTDPAKYAKNLRKLTGGQEIGY